MRKMPGKKWAAAKEKKLSFLFLMKIEIRLLTEECGAFAYYGNRDYFLPLERITSPTKEKSEQHPASPRQTSSDTSFRQFES